MKEKSLEELCCNINKDMSDLLTRLDKRQIIYYSAFTIGLIFGNIPAFLTDAPIEKVLEICSKSGQAMSKLGGCLQPNEYSEQFRISLHNAGYEIVWIKELTDDIQGMLSFIL